MERAHSQEGGKEIQTQACGVPGDLSLLHEIVLFNKQWLSPRNPGVGVGELKGTGAAQPVTSDI